MLIVIGITVLIYSFLIWKGKHKILPFKLKSHKDYNKTAKSIMLLGSLLLFLGIFSRYREIDILAIIMVIIIIILIFIKIIYSLNLSN